MITNRPKEGTWENSMKNSWVFLIWGPSTLGHTFWSDADIYMYVYGERSTIHVYEYIYLHLHLYLYIHIHDILKILQKLQITVHKISQDMVTTGTNCYPEVLHLPSQDLKSHLASLVLFVSSSIILGVVITKGNHDYVFIECPKHRVKREALISPSLTNSTSFSEITLFTILFLPDLFLWINVHMSDQKIHFVFCTHMGLHWTYSITWRLFLSIICFEGVYHIILLPCLTTFYGINVPYFTYPGSYWWKFISSFSLLKKYTCTAMTIFVHVAFC